MNDDPLEVKFGFELVAFASRVLELTQPFSIDSDRVLDATGNICHWPGQGCDELSGSVEADCTLDCMGLKHLKVVQESVDFFLGSFPASTEGINPIQLVPGLLQGCQEAKALGIKGIHNLPAEGNIDLVEKRLQWLIRVTRCVARLTGICESENQIACRIFVKMSEELLDTPTNCWSQSGHGRLEQEKDTVKLFKAAEGREDVGHVFLVLIKASGVSNSWCIDQADDGVSDLQAIDLGFLCGRRACGSIQFILVVPSTDLYVNGLPIGTRHVGVGEFERNQPAQLFFLDCIVEGIEHEIVHEGVDECRLSDSGLPEKQDIQASVLLQLSQVPQ